MAESEGRIIHGQAEAAREGGDFRHALELTDRASLVYQSAGDRLGLAEAQASRALTFKLLFQQTGDNDFLVLAKYSAMSSVDIARASGVKEAVAIPLFNLAKALESMGEFSEAVNAYREALENMVNNPPSAHDRPAVVADFKVHLTTCEYRAGDKTALQRAEQALKELEDADEISKYNKDVWVSGGYMKIAEMLREDEPTKAKDHLNQAKAIIDSNPELKLRKSQWEELAKTFS